MPKNSQCVLCGSVGEVTKDHLPPKSCFPSPKPNNLITVRACKKCNGGRSLLDNKFSLFLSMAAHGQSLEGRRLWAERARALVSNKALMTEVLAVRTESEDRYRFSLDFAQFEPLFQDIFRGLYYREFRDIYPPDKIFDLTFKKQLSPRDFDLIRRLSRGSVGANMFFYGIGRAAEDPTAAAGIISFYGKFAVTGVCAPINHSHQST
jgi:hypothetical protein